MLFVRLSVIEVYCNAWNVMEHGKTRWTTELVMDMLTLADTARRQRPGIPVAE